MKTNFLTCMVLKDKGLVAIKADSKQIREHNVRILMLDTLDSMINTDIDPVNREEVLRKLLNKVESCEVVRGVYALKFINIEDVDDFNMDDYVLLKRVLTKLELKGYMKEFYISSYIEEMLFS